ncbi:MAG: SIMPL domain-containing protein [Rhizobiaceae bacterium]|nr:SIMPL domain-containing protein [Rhizobiaceae bacterium]
MIRTLAPFAIAAALILPLPALAQQQPQTPRIVVTGEGEAAVSPDMAIVSLSVMREAETARAALDANNEAMGAVIAALKEAGIADRDLQTSGLSIQPRWDYSQGRDGSQEARLVAYQVTNSLTIRVRDLTRLGAVIDGAVTLGVNQGGSISFTNDDPDAVIDRARRAAVADAAARARSLAEAAGVELGDILEITEQADAPPPMPLGNRAMRMEASDASVPVEAGENSYQVRVTMSFAIEQ